MAYSQCTGSEHQHTDANCSISYYDESPGVDNLMSTWATNYMIGAISLLAVGYLLMQTSPSRCMIAYFLLTSVGYTLAGVYHHVIDDTNDKAGNALYYISVSLTILALPWLEVTMTGNTYVHVGIVVSNLAVCVVLVTLFLEVVAGFWFLASFFVMTILFGFRRQFHRSFAALLFVIGFLVLGILTSTCSERDSYRDCMLPNPTVFNQNGLFHVFVALGVLCQWIAEARDPTCGFSRLKDDGDRGTVGTVPSASHSYTADKSSVSEDKWKVQPLSDKSMGGTIFGNQLGTICSTSEIFGSHLKNN